MPIELPYDSRPPTNPDGDPAGSWSERECTGTGFPKVFYLRYAWAQDFEYGHSRLYYKGNEFRAVAVRRFVL